MSPEHRNIWSALAVGLAVNLWVLTRVLALVSDGSAARPDAMQVWAATVLWAIPAAILGTIALGLVIGLFAPSGPVRKDERDRQFQVWGMGVTMVFMVAGLLAAISGLALGLSGFVAFNLVYFGCALGDIFGNILKLLLYRFR